MEWNCKCFTKQYTQSLKQCSQLQYVQFILNSIVTFLKTSLQFQFDDRIINSASLLNVRQCNSKTGTERISDRIILQNTDVTFALSVTFRTWRLRRSELLLPDRSLRAGKLEAAARMQQRWDLYGVGVIKSELFVQLRGDISDTKIRNK
jgi:hypothetical protein